MAALNVNGRLHLTGVHQKPPASLHKQLKLLLIFFLSFIYKDKSHIFIYDKLNKIGSHWINLLCTRIFPILERL